MKPVLLQITDTTYFDMRHVKSISLEENVMLYGKFVPGKSYVLHDSDNYRHVVDQKYSKSIERYIQGVLLTNEAK